MIAPAADFFYAEAEKTHGFHRRKTMCPPQLNLAPWLKKAGVLAVATPFCVH